MMKRTAACLAAMMLVMLAALMTARPVMAKDADNATFTITTGTPPAEPDVVGTDEETTASFTVALYNKDVQRQEEPAANVKSQNYTVSAGDDSTITNVSGGGEDSTTTGATGDTWIIADDKHSATLSVSKGGSTPAGVSVTVSFSAAGEKTVSLSGGVTFDDGSTAPPSSASAKVTVEDVVWDIYTPIGGDEGDGTTTPDTTTPDITTQGTTPTASATTSTPAPSIQKGFLVKPQDQSKNPPVPAQVFAATGQSVDCAVTTAEDKDRSTTGSKVTYPNDTLTYKWSAKNSNGTVVNGFEDANIQSTKWKAPLEADTYTLTCTIDDKWTGTGPKNLPNVARNDPAVVRTVTVTVVSQVESVEWVAINSPLGENENTGGGKSIFPDKDSLQDDKVKTTVLVKAKVPGAKPGTVVNFKGFDVDDPGSDAAPLDPNDVDGKKKGSDNFSMTGRFTEITPTNADGYATAVFELSISAGDNFRVAASTLEADFKGLDDDVVPSGDEQVASFKGKLTPMLTIWRRLHVEVDTMAKVTGNTVKGRITDVDINTDGTFKCTTDQTLDDDVNRFVAGKLNDPGKLNGVYEVVSNTAGAKFTVTVKVGAGGTPPASDTDFTLVDDDTLKDGDDIRGVDTSLLAKLYKPAYITVDEIGGGARPVMPFHRNIVSEQSGPFDLVGQESRDIASTPLYWVTHCVGMFQPTRDSDGDPTRLTMVLGLSSFKTAAVFYETLQENSTSGDGRALVLAHEIGHNFGLKDEYADIPPYNDPSYNGIMRKVTSGVFTDENLRAIRTYGFPSKF